MKNILKKFKKFSKKFSEPNINYEAIGVAKPMAWKYIVFCTLPLGLVLLPSITADIESIPAIAEYPNMTNTMIGLCFVVGSIQIIEAWYCTSKTISKKILKEIQGLFFIAAGYGAVFLCGIPYLLSSFIHILDGETEKMQLGAFTLFMSLGCTAGAFQRMLSLIKNHWKTLKVTTKNTEEK